MLTDRYFIQIAARAGLGLNTVRRAYKRRFGSVSSHRAISQAAKLLGLAPPPPRIERDAWQTRRDRYGEKGWANKPGPKPTTNHAHKKAGHQ